eukprot:6667836-Pyramimonas_sp.AAC.1
MFDLDVGDCFTITDDEQLSPDEAKQLSDRVDLFKTGITDMARSLFAEAKAKVDSLREEHKQLSQRVAKKRKTDGGAVADGAGVPVEQAPLPA